MPPTIMEETQDGQPAEDVLSSGLRRMSQQLSVLRLSEIAIGTGLFWPSTNLSPTPHWEMGDDQLLTQGRACKCHWQVKIEAKQR